MNKQPHIKILILNWNGEKIIKKCIDSINNLSYSNYSKELVNKETMLLEHMQKPIHNLDNLVNSLGVNDMDEIPDDIAVLKVTRG